MFQYPRVDRLVSAGWSVLPGARPASKVSVSSGGSIGVCWRPPARVDAHCRGVFQYPRVDRLVSAGDGLHSAPPRNVGFQYPRVDRLVSAGGVLDLVMYLDRQVSVSSGGSIGVCWLLLRSRRQNDALRFQYPRVDRLVSAGATGRFAGDDPGQFQYPRVDRLVSAGLFARWNQSGL